MKQDAQYFDWEQANAIVRAIRPIMAEIMVLRQSILEKQPELWPVIEKAVGNGGSRTASYAVETFQRMDQLVREIRATGAILRDINSGLVDFLALREGREVYLCWRYGEDQVYYWHDIDAGFAGRKLLP